MTDCVQRKGKERERNWKDEEIEMLITLYEERPWLWDVGRKDYINKDSKEVVYSQIDLLITQKYDISREDYKSKWKIIRSQFMREQALERRKKSGQQKGDVYHPSWKGWWCWSSLLLCRMPQRALIQWKCEYPVILRLPRTQFIHTRMRSSFVFRNNVSSLSHWGNKTFCSFPANLATPGNITGNNVSATKFPSLARP